MISRPPFMFPTEIRYAIKEYLTNKNFDLFVNTDTYRHMFFAIMRLI
jgi:hypothetical protein